MMSRSLVADRWSLGPWPTPPAVPRRGAWYHRTVMHIWSALAAREIASLAILLLLGAGPASYLPPRFDGISRVALAPLLGFCLGTCVTTTILWFAPVNDTYWVLIPLSLGSAAVALVRARRGRRAGERPGLPRLRDVAALLVVAVAV